MSPMRFGAVLVALLIYHFSWAQELGSYAQVSILSGGDANIPVNSQAFPEILRYPKHGSIAKFKYGYEDVYRLRYTVAPGFQGLDTVIYQTERIVGGRKVPFFEGFIAKVSAVLAADDYYSIYLDDYEVDLSVLDNDISITNLVTLDQISYVSGGHAVINDDRDAIVFTPKTSGYVRIGYVVCDGDNCSSADVVIRIDDRNAKPRADTIKYIIERDNEVTILVGPGFNAPSTAYYGGNLTRVANQVYNYRPRLGFTGHEVLKFQRLYQGQQILHIASIEVVDPFLQNGWNKEDQVYTEVNSKVHLSVLDNDLGGTFSDLITSGLVGELTTTGVGTFIYTPPLGFDGQTMFSYQSCKEGRCDWADVYITVHNYEPLTEEVKWYTTKNRPLQVNYAVPIDDFFFESALPAAFGTLEIAADGKSVQYIPKPDFTGVDHLALKYCCPASDFCKVVYVLVNVQDYEVLTNCEECIWPGDHNNDGTVDVQDAVVLALNLGETGPTRSVVPSAYWYGQAGAEWTGLGANSNSNLKYVDGNGDGIISGADLDVVADFYDLSHGLAITPPKEMHQVPLTLTLLTPVVEAGDLAVVEVSLGNAATQAEATLGVNFSFEVNSRFVDSSSIEFAIATEGLFNPNNSVIAFAKSPRDGQIDVGIAKTDKQPIKGHGVLGEIRFIVEEDLNGFRSLKDILKFPVSLKRIALTKTDGTTFSLPDESEELSLDASKKGRETTVAIYPNPVVEQLHLVGPIANYRILDLQGRVLIAQNTEFLQDVREISVKSLSSGFYTLQVTTLEGAVQSIKFVITR